MRHNKFAASLLVLAMALALVACGEAEKNASEDFSVSVESQKESNTRGDAGNSQNKGGDIKIEKLNTDVTIEETVLFDENNLKITATDLSYTNYSVELNLLFENNSDKDMTFISGSLGYSCNAVNGYMIDDGYLNVDVSAGKKANETISFNIEGLSLYGITEIADIQIGFDISDDDRNHTYSGSKQVKTSAADSYDYATDTYIKSINSGVLETIYDCTIDYFAEDRPFDQGGIQIVSETLMTNKDGKKVIFLEIENHSSESVYGAASNISVNGLIVYNGIWSTDSINPGARRIMDLSLSSMLDEAYWNAFGISDIGEVTCSFAVKDSDYNEINVPQEICITIPGVTSSLDVSGMELYNENGIRFISKGMVEDSSKYSDDIHMLLLVENNSSEVIKVDDVYDSLSVNGFMTDYIVYSTKVPVGRCAMIDVKIQDSSLEKNGITQIEDITEVEISFEIEDDRRKTIAEPKLSIQY